MNSQNRIFQGIPRDQMVIRPGEFFATRRDLMISTLLGSCVAACLFDPTAKVIGMNHFMIAKKHHQGKPVETGKEARYGLQAMEFLIEEMIRLGASKSRIKAKVFGGGNVMTILNERQIAKTGMGGFNIGKINADFILDYLDQIKIPLVAKDLGGETGRVLYFDPKDYSVYVRKIVKKDNISKIVQMENLNLWSGAPKKIRTQAT